MRKRLKDLRTAILFAIVLLAGVFAKAGDDILLIDTNNVIPEIEHIRAFLKQEQAQGRELDTQLVIVPSEERLPMEVRKQIQDLHQKYIDSNSKFYQEGCREYMTSVNPKLKEKCDRTLETILSARKEVHRLMNGRHNDGSISVQEVEEELNQVLKGPYHFSRVIISGHHSAAETLGYIGGELFSGLNSTMAKELLNSSPATEDVRSVVMLGCWTGRQDMMQNAWGKVIPQATYHSGFIEEAPAKTNPTNMIILDSILKNEKQIGLSQNEVELRQNYSKLKTVDRRIGILVRDLYISPAGVKKIK